MSAKKHEPPRHDRCCDCRTCNLLWGVIGVGGYATTKKLIAAYRRGGLRAASQVERNAARAAGGQHDRP